MTEQTDSPKKITPRLIHGQIVKVTMLLARKGRMKAWGGEYSGEGVYVYAEGWGDEAVARTVNEQVTQQPGGRPLSKLVSESDVAELRAEHFGITVAEREQRDIANTKRGGSAGMAETLVKMQRALDDLARRVDKLEGGLPLSPPIPNGRIST